MHTWHADLIADRRLLREVHTDDLFRIGRLRVDRGLRADARRAFLRCLRYASPSTATTSLRALVWTIVLGLPPAAGRQVGEALVRVSRALERAGLTRRPAMS